MSPEDFMQFLAKSGVAYQGAVTNEQVTVRIDSRHGRRPNKTIGPDGAAVEFRFRRTTPICEYRLEEVEIIP